MIRRPIRWSAEAAESNAENTGACRRHGAPAENSGSGKGAVVPGGFHGSTRALRAFTLIEIMIVVLIIGILLAIAVPNFVKTRETTRAKACMENLRKIDWAKDQWAMEHQKAASATPTTTDLAGSFKYLVDLPDCPGGGTYTINNVSTSPTCSYGGGGIHVDIP